MNHGDSKREKLDTILKELKSFVVAFSGGVDSSFLLYRANALKKTEYDRSNNQNSIYPRVLK